MTEQALDDHLKRMSQPPEETVEVEKGYLEYLEEENAKLKGEWEKEEYRCPQCGLGNPRIAQLEEENAELKRLAFDVLTEWNNWGIRGDFPNPLTVALQTLADALLTAEESE